VRREREFDYGLRGFPESTNLQRRSCTVGGTAVRGSADFSFGGRGRENTTACRRPGTAVAGSETDEIERG